MKSFFGASAHKKADDSFSMLSPAEQQKDTRFDFGPGIGRCGQCRSFPHSNRGCGSCGMRLCKPCAADHVCKCKTLDTMVQLRTTISCDSKLDQCSQCYPRPSNVTNPSALGSLRENRPPLVRTRQQPANSRFTSLLLDRNPGRPSLGSADLEVQVQLPTGASVEEWIAVNTVEFFNELNLLAGALVGTCTEQSCPCMSAGPYVFAWRDDQDSSEPTHLPAPRYMEQLLTWVDQRLADEHLMPTATGAEFPANFRAEMEAIYKRLLRIYAHILHAHLDEFIEQEADAHLNHSLKHFMCFAKEFDLISQRHLLAPCFFVPTAV